MKNRGFTLLEVIMAITVLTVAVGGIFALLQQTLVAASLNKSKLTAYYLAQEGIEIVRNIRDSNWLGQRTKIIAWDYGLGTGEGEADYKDSALSGYASRYLNIDDDGFYSYSSGVPTQFKRKISLAKKSGDMLEVSVEVSWSERGRDHKVKAVSHLYNWYGY